MQNYLITFSIIIISIISLTIGSNLSIYARSMQYTKEDLEVALHDASLQIDLEQFADGKIVFLTDQALQTFKNSFELNSKIKSSDYEIIEFHVFDHSNTNFPVTYISNTVDYQATFYYPTLVAVLKTYTDKYFFTSQIKPVTRIASYTYKF